MNSETPLRFLFGTEPGAPTIQRFAAMGAGSHVHQKGYIRISAGPYRNQYLHILVWKWTHPGEAFDPELHNIDHIDGNRTNFHPDNLRRVPREKHPSITMRYGRLGRKKNGKFTRRARPKDLDVSECPF